MPTKMKAYTTGLGFLSYSQGHFESAGLIYKFNRSNNYQPYDGFDFAGSASGLAGIGLLFASDMGGGGYIGPYIYNVTLGQTSAAQ